MNKSEFTKLIEGKKSISFMLPNQQFVPKHFHITEIGLVIKRFFDCGGTERENKSCVLQIWVANDFEHRLAPEKVLKIFEKTNKLFLDDFPIEVEYQGEQSISLFSIESASVQFSEIVFTLGTKQTTCLAPDKCGIEGCK